MFALITRHCTPPLIISAAMHKKAAKPFANICSLDTAIAIDGALNNITWYVGIVHYTAGKLQFNLCSQCTGLNCTTLDLTG